MIRKKDLEKVFVALTMAILISCSNDDVPSLSFNKPNVDPDTAEIDDQVNSFIYNGLNVHYLYKDDQPLLSQSFNSINEGTPEEFFENLIIEEDRFSYITDDYIALENSFGGINLSDGIDFRLSRIDGSSELIGYVYYVDKNSAGEIAGVQRGDFFTTVNGETLTDANYIRYLFDDNSYDVELLTYNNSTDDEAFSVENLEFRTETTVSKFEYIEDPILVNKVIDYEGLKIGYLMYTRFLGGSENELNTIFGEFSSLGIDELILDLRYNGGGRVSTAVDLSGMITGQFTDEILILEQWNSYLQNYYGNDDPESLYTRFRAQLADGETDLNSLNLTKLYVISSKGRTASASELVINGLGAYIDVIHVGDQEGTVGKSQASRTLYDSPALTNKNDINDVHTYAIQPLIYRSANKDGFSVPNEGLTPDVFATEDVTNLGILGEIDEPLLNVALNTITGNSLAAKNLATKKVVGETVTNSKERYAHYQRMYE